MIDKKEECKLGTYTITNDMVKELVADGFTEKMAYCYLNKIYSEMEDGCNTEYKNWAHKHGFTAHSAIALGINESNYKNFISDYEYHKGHPYNQWTRIWVNDKLTIKYLLRSSCWNKLMPEYYYYSMPDGSLRCLCDNPYEKQDFEHFCLLLRERGTFACKPNNGQAASNFYKLSFDENKTKYYINEEICDKKKLRRFLDEHINYVYTEYLKPGKGMELISPLVHTLRVVVVNEDGINPIITGGSIRFATHKSGESNYIKELGKDDKYMYYASVDMKSGEIINPMAIYGNKAVSMPCHPDTGYNLSKGFIIPDWDIMRNIAMKISKYLVGCSLLGYDFCVTENGWKLMEINTLPGIIEGQFSWKENDVTVFTRFIRKKIKEINAMALDEQLMRKD